jgi:NAD+ synthase (glutamine-hydrolysing)
MSSSSRTGPIKIGGATVNQTPLDWTGNLHHIIQAIEAAKEQNIKILCLPELCITGYGCEDLFLADWFLERAWAQLETLKKYCANITVCAGLPLRINGLTYNGACVISNQKILGITLKQILARNGVHYEPRWFTPWKTGQSTTIEKGDESIQVGDIIYEAHGLRFGFEICEDAWHKDRAGLNLLPRQVDLILNPSASHFALGKSLRREKLVMNSTRQLNCVYLYTNLLGNEAGRMIYDGDILIAQQGKLLAQNKRFAFTAYNLISCEVDFDQPENSEQQEITDNKEKNEELTRAVTLALYDYLRKSKAKGYALSLSGGADSSMCAVLVAEMVKRAVEQLGGDTFCHSLHLNTETNSNLNLLVKKILTCAYQSTNNSSNNTFQSAKMLAEFIGAEFHHWSVQAQVDSYTQIIEEALKRSTNWQTDDISLQNIQARSRSPVIWMLANIKQAILLTTSNRSEGDIGYTTMDGDTSGSLAPVAGLDKPFIRQWLQWAETTLGYTALHAVNALQPTAELRPQGNHQTDESDLMPYTTLVEIEHHAILHRKSPVEVFHAMKATNDKPLLKAYIYKFFKLWSANQWKRERFAPAFHLDALNVDPKTWCRFPILSGGFTDELKALEEV